MNLFKKGKKLNVKRLVAALVAVAMLGGYMPTTLGNSVSAADLVTNKVADPNTATRPVDLFAGTTLNAGRVMVGKTVDTERANYSSEATGADWLVSSDTNFLVTISQASQAMGVSSEIPVPIDAVFVLDTSGSMAYDIDSTKENDVDWEDQRATHMVTAANDAIASLLAANSLNRVAVVAFSDNTTTLSELYSYTGTAATNHLTWDGNRIVGRDADGSTGNSRNGKNGGTNIHAGIAAGAKILAEAENTTVKVGDKEVTRIPFLIVLSDGAPTRSGSSADWTNPSGTQGPGGSVYVGNGFLPVLTASYYKNVISKNYFGDNVTESNRAYMYTIGIGVDGLSDDEKALALLTLNPKENMNSQNSYYENSTNHDFKYYWEQYQADKTFEILVNNDDTYTIGQGTYREYQGGGQGGPGGGQGNWVEVSFDNHQPSVTSLIYNDNYYPANDATGLETAFRNIVVEIQKRAITYPTLTDASMTANYSGYVTFRDVIGEYMEVKDMKGIVADGHLFQGAQFAYYMSMTRDEVHADAGATAFMEDLVHSMEVRFGLRLPGETDAVHASMDQFLNDAWNWAHNRDYEGNVLPEGTNPLTQMYYNSSTDFDNSICWWGHTADDGTVQMMGWAADDSIEYIEAAKAMTEDYEVGVGTAVADGAEYVARSYFFYGTAGGSMEQEKEYLDFSVTVMRELEAPYTQTVVISAPASLLSMQRVLIYDTDKDGNLTAYFDEVIPTRVVYEVGLRDDITAESAESILSEEYKAANKVDGGYVFYTNEWDRGATGKDDDPKAMTVATFGAETSNAYYVFDTNTPIYVKQGDTYVKYTGDAQPSGEGYYYAHEYYTWDKNATAAQGAAGVTCSKVQVEYIEMDIPTPENTTQVKWDSTQGCWVILAGTFKAQSLVSSGIEEKTQNLTGTGKHIAHPVRTGGETDPKYAVYLGNNGKLTFATDDAKSVFNANGDDIDGLTAMVGDELTYKVTVTNIYDKSADATIVDTIPDGTELVADSVKVYKDGKVQTSGYTFTQTGDVLTWKFTGIPADSAYTVEFKVKVTEAALDISTVSNQATITLGDNTYKTNLVSNPIEGKKVTGATSAVVPADGVQVGDELVYTIQYYNDTTATTNVTIVDQIPAGTEYVADSATNGGTLTNGVLNWTIENVAPGTGGTVSFKVEVTAAALTVNPFTNTATIQVGTNAPVQSTNTTSTKVKVGDLVLTKTVEAEEGLNPKANQEFVLVLTETSGLLKDAAEEFALVDASGNPVKDSNNNDIKVKFDTNSQAKVTVKDGQTLTVKGLPVGVTIVVAEEPVAGYTPAYSPSTSAMIVENTTAEDAARVDVTNTYVPDPYNAATLFEFKKVLTSNGIALTDKKFEFVAHLADANGNLSHERASVMYGEVTVDSGEGAVKIAFGELKISQPGIYYYLVTEAVGSDGGIYYDPTEFLISFEVVDNGTGKLELKEGSVTLKARANVDQAWDAAADWTFENIYTPAPTGVVLEANKVLNNRVLADEFFTFEVVDTKNNNKVVATAKNKADGSITFPEIQFTAAGEYVYKIYEVDGGRENYTYDADTYTVTVVVTDDGNGNLVVSTINGKAPDKFGEFDFSAIEFVNTYTPDSATATVQAIKDMVGRAQIEGEFVFTLSGGNLQSALTAENDASGSIVFPELSYTLEDIGYPAVTSKTFTYTIAEVAGNDDNIGYTDKTLTVNVTVSYDPATGLMEAEAAYPDGQTLTNTYTPDPIQIFPVGTKVTDNYASADEKTTFTFNVVDAEGNVLLSGTSGLMGAINYTDGSKVLEYDHNEVGTHNYWIVEQNDEKSGIAYDGTIYLMQVDVSQHSVTGLLSADVKYYKVTAVGDTSTATPAADASFRNSYAAVGTLTIAAEKILSGRPLNDGEFWFELKDSNGNLIKDEVGNSKVKADENGLITFPTIQLTGAGNFIYYATEVIPADADKLGGVTYDTNTYAIHINVVDNGGGKYIGTVTDVQVKTAGSETYVSTGLKSVVFNNTYATKTATITLEALKNVIGHAYTMKGGEFLFEVRNAADKVVAIGRNDATGKVVLDKIYSNDGEVVTEVTQGYSIQYTFADYLNSDTYVYTITEVSTVPSGFSHDETAHTVTVKLTDDKNGNLSAEAIYPTGGVTFTNTYTPAPTTAQITAQKILNGRGLKDGEFWFVLKDEDGNQIVASNTGNNVTFREITYTAAGTYTYIVSEVSGVLGGVVYDDVSYEVTVKVTDDAGKLKAEVIYPEGGVVFKNTYSAKPTSYRLAVTKSLIGRRMNADEFRFEMVDKDGKVVSIAYNASGIDGGIALFNAIEYTEAGTYTYTVYEKKGDLGGITYDETVYTVEITVTDDGAGQLHAAVTKVNDTVYADGSQYNPADITFKNTYKPASVSITLGAEGTVDISKVLDGRPLNGGEFTFELTGSELSEPLYASNDASGKIVFDPISYDSIGAHVYTIKEIDNGLGGVTYTTKTYMVVVEVGDNNKGQLITNIVYVAEVENEVETGVSEITFENTYKPAETTIQLGADKTLDIIKNLTGRELKEGEFEFSLTGTDLEKALSAKNDKEGKIIFPVITYTKAGTYTYEISEVKGEAGGVGYTSDKYTVTVTVTDNLEGQLVAEVTEVKKNSTVLDELKAEFNNTYKPEETNIQLEAKKALEVLTGTTTLQNGQFSFYLAEKLASGRYLLIEDKTNNAAGNVIFSALKYTEAGVHTYAIGENVGTNKGVTYDSRWYEVVVTVTDDGEGTLTAAITGITLVKGEERTPLATDAAVEFVNIYKAAPTTAQIHASKDLTGKDLENNEFSFLLESVGDVFEDMIVKNDADGKIVFPVEFTEAGTYEFLLTEQAGGDKHVTYDGNEFKITVTVKDDGLGQLYAHVEYGTANNQTPVFSNTYTPDPIKVTIEGTKKLTGKTLTDGLFIFQLLENGTEVATGTNTADGKFVINLEIAKPGEYLYEVVEMDTKAGGMTYDTSSWTVKVTVTAKDSGELEAAVDYVDGDIVFENSYDPQDCPVVITALKNLVGKELVKDAYEFEITEYNAETGKYEVRAKAKNAADGTITFSEIILEKTGTYYYVVSEVPGDEPGVAYDQTEYNIRVDVRDEDGVLKYEVTYTDGALVFNNTYNANSVDVEIGATKELTGKKLTDGEFTFRLTDALGNDVVAPVTNDASGNIVFRVNMDKAGTYHWTISEVAGKDGHITYDGHTYAVTVEVTDDGSGQLKAEVTYETADGKAPVFENAYTPDAIKVEIEGTKTLTSSLTDKKMTDGLFVFEVKDGDQVVGSGTNTADGKITIELKFAKPGRYEYTVVEKDVKEPGMVYDKTEYAVVIDVTAADSGELSAKVTYPDGGIVFENKYEPEQNAIHLGGLKTMTGKDLGTDKYIFVLEELVNGKYVEISRTVNEADGTIAFEPINDKRVGTHYYRISEVAGISAGVTYDSTMYHVEVNVIDDGTGTLKYDVEYVDGAVVFNNTYKAKPVTVTIGAWKELVGKELEAGEFTFVLQDEHGNNVVSAVTNHDDGSIEFKVELTEAGTYRWTIAEKVDDKDYILYDHQIYDVTVVVTDDTQLAQLVAQVEYGTSDKKAPVFKNTYTPEKVEVDLTLEGMTKELTGRDLVNGEFIFEVKDADGNVVATGKNGKDGKIVFDKKLTYTEKGEYTYTVYEVAGDDDHVTYDATVYTMNVVVTDDGKGTLAADVTYGEDGKGIVPAFKNVHTPDAVAVVLEALKELVGRELKDGEFTFEVKDADGNVVATGKNNADGKIVFTEIKLGETGTYTYTVYEVAGEAEDTIYDDSKFTVTVVVSDEDKDGDLEQKITYPEDGVQFVNEHYSEVDTGDNSQMILWIAVAALCVAAIGTVLVMRKKFK